MNIYYEIRPKISISYRMWNSDDDPSPLHGGCSIRRHESKGAVSSTSADDDDADDDQIVDVQFDEYQMPRFQQSFAVYLSVVRRTVCRKQCRCRVASARHQVKTSYCKCLKATVKIRQVTWQFASAKHRHYEQFKRTFKGWLFERAYGRRRVWRSDRCWLKARRINIRTYLRTYLLTTWNITRIMRGIRAKHILCCKVISTETKMGRRVYLQRDISTTSLHNWMPIMA